MPTGYTDAVGKGEVTEFADYAMLCARAFGATIMMRDDPLDAPIKELEPSTHYAEWRDQARKELAELESVDGDDLARLVETNFQKELASWEKAIGDKAKTRKNYEVMLEKAREYRAPTADHEDFAKFLVTQLEESIDFDCSTDHWPKPERVDPAEWKRECMAKLRKDIKRYTEEQEKENERTAGRNKWVVDLRASLA